jgi:hypothetical protein
MRSPPPWPSAAAGEEAAASSAAGGHRKRNLFFWPPPAPLLGDDEPFTPSRPALSSLLLAALLPASLQQPQSPSAAADPAFVFRRWSVFVALENLLHPPPLIGHPNSNRERE